MPATGSPSVLSSVDPTIDVGIDDAAVVAFGGRRRGAKRRSVPKPFDFRRPSKFSRDHFRAFQIVYETFARQLTTVLSTSLRAVSQVTLLEAQQQSYSEYIESMPNPSFLVLTQLSPLPGASLFALPLDLAMAAVDRMLGGPGDGGHPNRPLTDIESGLMKDLMDRCLRELTYAHESLFEIEPKLVQLESNPQFAQIAAPTDMVLVVPFEVRIGGSQGLASLCIPFTSLAPVLENFAGNHLFAGGPTMDAKAVAVAVRDRILDVPLDVHVRFDPISLTSSEIVELRIGDVVPLHHGVEIPLTVMAAGQAHLSAMPGRRGKRLACQIVDPYPTGRNE